MSTISAGPLALLLSGPRPPVLLHVLPPGSWDSQHLPDSHCACVYEMGFLESVHRLCADKSAPVVVYGAGLPSLDSATALEKLTADGYTNVLDFDGGIAAWGTAGFDLEGTGAAPQVTDFNGYWQVDAAGSVIRWTGRNLFNHHEGTVRLNGGHLEIKNGGLIQAGFQIDLRSIAYSDLVDAGYNAMLLRHLADRDFFETVRYPEAVYTADAAEPIPAATPGTPNFRISGHLTLRGMTRPLAFPAVIAVSEAGQLTAQAQIDLDRTQWGVNYGSGRLFAWLGSHVVNDVVSLHLKIHAVRS